MTAGPPSAPEGAWEREIRGWLLGRLGKNPTAGESSPAETSLGGRVLAWWVLEGKRHRFLGGSLVSKAAEAEREARRLDAVLSPEWRVEESPAAETDWVKTALLRPMDPVPRFVVRAASSGLTELEREALLGWRRWTVDLWRGYTAELGVPAGASPRLPWQGDEVGEPIPVRQLYRWAQAARRSRWPLLREVVAESFRAAVEPESIDRLPLPPGRDALFELLCAVRLLAAFAGSSRHVRWLGEGASGNNIRVPGVECAYQGWLEGQELSDDELGVECVRALRRHEVTLPRNFDALLRFDAPRGGFHGILIEAKSGAQSFTDTVYQLKAYRAALRGSVPGPLVVWGIVEGGGGGSPLDLAALEHDLVRRSPSEDFWLFTSEDEIGEAAQALGLLPGPGRSELEPVGWSERKNEQERREFRRVARSPGERLFRGARVLQGLSP